MDTTISNKTTRMYDVMICFLKKKGCYYLSGQLLWFPVCFNEKHFPIFWTFFFCFGLRRKNHATADHLQTVMYELRFPESVTLSLSLMPVSKSESIFVFNVGWTSVESSH